MSTTVKHVYSGITERATEKADNQQPPPYGKRPRGPEWRENRLEAAPRDGGEGEATKEEEAEAIWRPLAEVARDTETICLKHCSSGLIFFFCMPKWRFKTINRPMLIYLVFIVNI